MMGAESRLSNGRGGRGPGEKTAESSRRGPAEGATWDCTDENAAEATAMSTIQSTMKRDIFDRLL